MEGFLFAIKGKIKDGGKIFQSDFQTSFNCLDLLETEWFFHLLFNKCLKLFPSLGQWSQNSAAHPTTAPFGP